MKKVIVCYASAGIGHQRAAEAIAESLVRMRRGHVRVSLLDALDQTNRLCHFLYPATYLFFVHYLPTVWGGLYYLCDWKPLRPLVRGLRRWLNRFNSRRLVDYLLKERPDVVICTHFFSEEVIADLKQRGLFHGKLITVITDFGLHDFWVEPEVDHYIVATEATKAELKGRGISSEKVVVLGIPVRQAFSRRLDRQELFGKLGLQSGVLTGLITSGGFGVGPILSMVREFGRFPHPFQLLVVCGKNPRLTERVRKLTQKLKNPAFVYGYVTNMDELMDVADFIITKSGGLTSSEALAKELPMLLVRPIPGQEGKNAALLVRQGAALQVRSLGHLHEILREILHSPHRLWSMQQQIKEISRPKASEAVAHFLFHRYLHMDGGGFVRRERRQRPRAGQGHSPVIGDQPSAIRGPSPSPSS